MKPPEGVDFLVETLVSGTELFRVHLPHRDGNAFNPGHGQRTRFAFFGDPLVPVLYAGATPSAAVFESIFHDTTPGSIVPAHLWRSRVLSVLTQRRDLRLAMLHSDGLRKLGAHACDVTDTPASTYATTVLWAAAAHRRGLDGIVWMSRQFNSDRAYVLFGDRVRGADLDVLLDHLDSRTFRVPADEEWISALADRIDVTLSFAR